MLHNGSKGLNEATAKSSAVSSRRTGDWLNPSPRGPLASCYADSSQRFSHKHSHDPSELKNVPFRDIKIDDSTVFPHNNRPYPKERYPEKMKHRASQKAPELQQLHNYSHSPPDSSNVMKEALEYASDVKQLTSRTVTKPRYDHESLHTYSSSGSDYLNGKLKRPSLSVLDRGPNSASSSSSDTSSWSEVGRNNRFQRKDKIMNTEDKVRETCGGVYSNQIPPVSNDKQAYHGTRIRQPNENQHCHMNGGSLEVESCQPEIQTKTTGIPYSQLDSVESVYFNYLRTKNKTDEILTGDETSPSNARTVSQTRFGDTLDEQSISSNRTVVNQADERANYDNASPQSVKSVPHKKIEKLLEPWECQHCTYRNANAEKICDICAKSRDFNAKEFFDECSEDEPIPKLYSTAVTDGSRECNNNSKKGTIVCARCTLNNEKGKKVCQACDSVLLRPVSPHNFFR